MSGGSTTSVGKCDLVVVMPVYNEEAVIEKAVQQWCSVLEGLNLQFRLLVLNDGSRDGTKNVLDAYSPSSNLHVVHKKNSGHGPTILQGYRDAVTTASWVFQTDSDMEMLPEDFPVFWDQRAEFDFLIGDRQGRGGPVTRRLVTWILRWVLRIFYGPGIQDANCPFRLMRSEPLAPMLDQLPDDTFAPNAVLSGAFVAKSLRIKQIPVDFYPRSTGEVSIKHWKLLKGAALSFWQVFSLRTQFRKKLT